MSENIGFPQAGGTGYPKKLSASSKKKFREANKKITKKWLLASGRNVEDVIYCFTRNFFYEHPAHSWLLNFDDPIWGDAFTVSEMEEIKSQYTWDMTKKTLPNDLMNILFKLNNKSKVEEIYNEINGLWIDPVQERERHWIKSSIIDYCLLFVNNREIGHYGSERDLFEEVYKFIRQSRQMNSTETNSAFVKLLNSKNKETDEKEEIKREYEATIDFNYRDIELGYTKAILPMYDTDASKELIERELEVPKMLRKFMISLAKKNDVDHELLKTAGIIINGFFISIVVVSFKGSISVVTTSPRLQMPVSVEEIPRLLPRVLNLIYTYAMIMKDTVDLVKNSGSIVQLEAEDTFFPSPV